MKTEIIAGRKTGIRRVGRGKPALFLHCALGNSASLSGLVAATQDRLAIISTDLPGHGLTAFDPAQDFHDQSVETAVELLESRAPAHLFGHSFGASVALRVAAERPDLVASLSLYEPVYYSILPDHAFERETRKTAEMMNAVSDGDWLKAARIFMARWDQKDFDALAKEKQRYILGILPNLLNHKLSIMSKDKGAVISLSMEQIRVPVLLMRGAGTLNVIADIDNVITDRIPHVKQRVFQGIGHMGPITHAHDIAAELNQFLFAD